MTYQKFEKVIAEIGKKYNVDIFVYRRGNSLFVSNDVYDILAEVSCIYSAVVSTDFLLFPFLNEKLQIDILNACVQLASTPLGLREEKYIVPLPGLITTDGEQQYITERDGRWFACRRTEHLTQTWTKGQLHQIPEEYRKYAVEVEE